MFSNTGTAMRKEEMALGAASLPSGWGRRWSIRSPKVSQVPPQFHGDGE